MPETTITVQGRFSAFYPAERATVAVTVGLQGPKRDPVFAATTTSAESVKQRIVALHSPTDGPVTWWSSESIQVWTSRPHNQDGKIMPEVFHARVGFSVKFSDFGAMSRWIESVVTVDGVAVSGISWDLTEARKTAATAEVRSRAVKDAATKAAVYASAIGLGSVSAVAISDPGMLGDNVNASGGIGPVAYSRAAAPPSGGPALSFTPEDIEISTTVDCRFVAS